MIKCIFLKISFYLFIALFAAMPVSAHDRKKIFYVSFDKNIRAELAEDNAAGTCNDEPEFIDGISNAAIVLKENKIVYQAKNIFPVTNGTISFWLNTLDWNINEKIHYFFFAAESYNNNKRKRILLYSVPNEPGMRLLIENEESPSLPKTWNIYARTDSWGKNTWHHVLAVWNSKTMRLYLDGIIAGEITMIPMPDSGMETITIGRVYNHWPNIGTGSTVMDELCVYNYDFTGEEVVSHYRYYLSTSWIGNHLQEIEKNIKSKRERNLMQAGTRAYILSSSIADLSTFHPDNLIDGNEVTAWRSFDEQLPQWIEIRYPYEIAINKISFNEIKPSSTESFSLYSFKKDQWHLIKEINKLKKEDDWMTVDFPDEYTDRIKLVINKNNGPFIQYGEFELYGPAQTIYEKIDPYWKAAHIWFPEPDKKHKPNSPRYFRKSVDISMKKKIISAFILLRSNDSYKLFINGKLVTAGSTKISPVEVQQYLAPGTNIIAVVTDLGSDPKKYGWAQFIAELTINYENSSERIGTDSTWKSSGTFYEGWNTPNYDDSSWQASIEHYRPPEGPWGKIAYFNTMSGEQAVLDSVSIPSKYLIPGKEAKIIISLTPKIKLRNNYVFMFEIGNDIDLGGGQANYLLKRIMHEPAIETSKWPAGKAAKIELNFIMPEESPNEFLPLKVRGVSKTDGSSLIFFDKETSQKTNILCFLPIKRFDITNRTSHSLKISVNNISNNLVIAENNMYYPPLFFNIQAPNLRKIHAYSGIGIKVKAYALKNLLSHMDPESGHFESTLRTLDETLQHSQAIDPNSRYIISLDLLPRIYFGKKYPDDFFLGANGQKENTIVCYASPNYLNACEEALEKFFNFIKTKSYYEHIIGYVPYSCGWPDAYVGNIQIPLFKWERDAISIGDYNPYAVKAFQNFLRKKYNNSISALQQSWKNNQVNFDTAKPDNKILTAAGANGEIFRNPCEEGNHAFDYYEFFPSLLGMYNIQMAKKIKELTQNQKLVGSYYLYQMQAFKGVTLPAYNLVANNFDQYNLLQSPYIDFFAGVFKYEMRLSGNPFIPYHMPDTMKLYNKLYISELDTRTILSEPITYGRERSMEETISCLTRNIGYLMMRGMGGWLLDFGAPKDRKGMGWFDHPDILTRINKGYEIYAQNLRVGNESTSEIAVIFSPETMYYQDMYSTPIIYKSLTDYLFLNELPKIGTPFDVYNMRDLDKIQDNKKYKLYIFINPFFMTDSDHNRINKLKSENRTLLFFYAPGYVHPLSGLKTESVSRITEIEIKKKQQKEEMKFRILNAEHAVTEGTADKEFALSGYSDRNAEFHPLKIGPVFYIDDNTVTALGVYPDGSTAMAVKSHTDWKSIYCAVPRLDRYLLQNIARFAGVHIFCTNTDIYLHASSKFLMIHNGYDNHKELTIQLPKPTVVKDLYTDKVVSSGKINFKININKAQTLFFRID